ncbi:MAG: glucose/sorbosone dehydrogenase-like protein [Chloroflexi bacterium OLB14]|nr:MAG: glucose/sorbosone dehydrogenase-like protein [Chloroflexi bacterium OLB14]
MKKSSLTSKSIFVIFTLLLSLFLTPYSTQALAPNINLGLEEIISGLSSPVGIVNAGDNSNRLFIVLSGGEIMVYDGSQVLATPFLDISSLTSSGGEQGLLGLAFHPNYENNGYFYVNYTRVFSGQLQTVIARYQVSGGDPNIANQGSASIIMTIDQDDSNHNGGQIEFGPDGYLYIGMGDGGGGGDPHNRSQDPISLLGKMLRIDVDSGSPYAIPSSNPFTSNASVSDEIWALGLRNPWRFSFDKLTGDLFIADVGQNQWEEVNIQPAASTGGENYGWSCYEGNHTYNSGRDCDDYGTLTPPAIEYNHGPGESTGCSITGGYVYRGTKYPQIYGMYIYGDFCSGKIWLASKNVSVWTSELALDTSYLISTFGQDENGEIYLASYGEGKIYKISVSTFADVPETYWAHDWIERLYAAGLTGGCTTSPLNYCPTLPVTRAEMAVFLERGLHGNSFTPPNVPATFGDTAGHWAEDWIEALKADGITGGCGDGNYCPNAPVTRAEMAVFLLRVMHSASYTPPNHAPTFGDSAGHWAEDWIEQLAIEGITSGCGGGNYCPNSPATRDQMAVFLVNAFGLP